NRVELQNAVSISRLKSITEKQEVSLIGMISSKSKTKNDNIIISLEDPTGSINILINKSKPELIEIADDLVLDEVIGIKGVLSENIIFINNLFFPDITEIKPKKAKDEGYAVFASDIHLGLKNFLAEDFINFIKWLNLEYGTDEQKEIAKKVKYLFLVGDLVEGVGVYPGQENDLLIKDIYEQYRALAEILSKVPKSIKMIICAGNHDAVRVAEPQPILDKKIAKSIYDLENVTVVTNPSLVNIHASKDFLGFNILLYHGFSMAYYADVVNSIRTAGGQDRADLIMKFFLQRRHFAPTHASNTYIPDPEQDFMLIDKTPDFLVTGHIHKVSTANYKGVTCLNCSCWASISEAQEKRGLNPDPSKPILVNLKTRDISVLNFSK
ncbi:metallophosphoesterase, partial [Candidatus Woesearchaeota archaeon]|nr:metallophosphoesterase [Candidatus Woesearchaeota archaeon]